MGFVYWSLNSDGDWSSPANWGNDVPPGSGDVVVIDSASLHTVTHSSQSQTADTIAGLEVGNDNFAMTGGSLTILGTATMLDGCSVSGGTLTLDRGMTLADGFTQTGGTVVSTGPITITGTAELLGGVITGSAGITASSTVTLANETLAGSVQLRNAHTIAQTGNVLLGDITGTNATIVNLKGATYSIANAVTLESGAATALLSNAGLLADAAGTGTSTIDVSVTSTGTVAIGTGSTLLFAGALTSLAGSISGPGTLGCAGGTMTIASTTTLSVAAITLFNITNNTPATLVFGHSATLTAGYVQYGASTLDLGSATLTVNSAAQFFQNAGAPLVTGTGTLLTEGMTTLDTANQFDLVLGGALTWRNTGTVTLLGTLQIGNSASVAATFSNAAGGVLDLGAAAGVVSGSTPASSFNNAGTLAMIAAGGTTTLVANLVSTGSVSVASGDLLQIEGSSNSFAGSLGGAGTLGFAAGSSSIAGGSVINVATLAIYDNGTNLAFAGKASVAGAFDLYGQSTVTLGGQTLTLAGAVGIALTGSTAAFAGSGVLATSGATGWGTGAGLILGGSVTWNNSGTVTELGALQIGSLSTAAAAVANLAKGVFDLAADVTISSGSTPASGFSNAGLLAMTANGGTATISANLASTGAIAVASGDWLQFTGTTASIAGSIRGAGTFGFASGSSSSIAAGTTLSVATLAIYDNGTSVTFAGNDSITAALDLYGSSSIVLTGHTLTLAGGAAFAPTGATASITGSGVLVTSATTMLNANDGLLIGSGVAWRNSGTVDLIGGLTIGNAALQGATVANSAGGVFVLAAGAAIATGSTTLSGFSNAGTFEQIAGTATTNIGANFTNSGHVTASSGTLAFNASLTNTGSMLATGSADLSFAGSVSGTGVITLNDGFASFTGPVASGQRLAFGSGGGLATISLATPGGFAATISGFAAGDTIDLHASNIAGATPTVSGDVLTFTNNSTAVATLSFATAPTLSFASDNAGGILITAAAAHKAAFSPLGRQSIAVTGQGVESIAGFADGRGDVLDLRALLAGTPAAQDLSLLGDFLTARTGGGGTTLLFDPTGHGGGGAVAVLTGVATSLDQLLAQHALRL